MKEFYLKIKKNWLWGALPRLLDGIFNLLTFFIVIRFIKPADFGLFCIVVLAVSTLEFFTQTGFDLALIQKSTDINSYLDTAWLVQACRGTIVFVLMFFSAPLIADFFHEPAVVDLLRFSCIANFLISFSSMGWVCFSKGIEFRKKFQIYIWPRIMFMATAILFSYLLRNAWGLVFGQVCAAVVTLFVSYSIHDFRPGLRFNFVKFRELYHFGKWVFCYSVVAFFMIKIDLIFIGKNLGVAQLGLYQIAFSLANFVADPLAIICDDVVFPMYSAFKYSKKIVADIYVAVLEAASVLAGGFCGIVLMFADRMVWLFLGPAWMPAVPVLRILAIYCFLRLPGNHSGSVFRSIGHPDIILKTSLFKVFFLLVLLLWFRHSLSLELVAFFLLLSIFFVDLLTQYIVALKIGIFLKSFFVRIFVFPIAAMLFTCSVVWLVRFPFGNNFSKVGGVLWVMFFVVVYLWFIYIFAQRILGRKNYFKKIYENLKFTTNG
jgi:O-antigen/teichoic acid export membrane protein